MSRAQTALIGSVDVRSLRRRADATVRSVPVHVNFHPLFETAMDRAYQLRCIYAHPKNITLTVTLGVRGNETSDSS